MSKPSQPQEDIGAAFCTDKFDVVKWVNAHIATRSSTLPRLDLLSQDINDQLERGMSLILGSVPRVGNEVEQLQRDSASLKPTLSALEESVLRITPPSGESDPLETLQQLNTIRDNIAECCSILEQAATWDKLVRDVDMNFSSRNLTAVATQLGDLRESLLKLEGMPGQEGRVDMFERFEERLETLITPGLREALAVEDDMGPLRNYLQIFDRLGRTKVLVDEYAASRGNKTISIWEGIAAMSETTKLERLLPRYLDEIAIIIQDESKRAFQVFGTEASVIHNLSVVVCKILSNANAPLSKLFADRSKLSNSNDLEIAFSALEDFLNAITVTLKQDFATQLQTLSDRDSIQNSAISKIIAIGVKPIVEALSSFEVLERETLKLEYAEGNHSTLTSEDASVDSRVFQALGRSDLFEMLERAVDRSLKIGYGTQLDVSLKQIWNMVKQHCDSIVELLSCGEFNQLWNTKSPDEQFSDCLQLLRQTGKFQSRLEESISGIFDRIVEQSSILITLNDSTNFESSQPLNSDTRVVSDDEPAIRINILVELIRNANLDQIRTISSFDVQGGTDRVSLLFPDVTETFENIAIVIQKLAFGVLLNPLLDTFDGVQSLDSWALDSQNKGVINSEGDQREVDSVSPQQYALTLGNLLTGDEYLSKLSQFGDAAAAAQSTISIPIATKLYSVIPRGYLREKLTELQIKFDLPVESLRREPFEQVAKSLEHVTQSWLSSCYRVLLAQLLMVVDEAPTLTVLGLKQLMLDFEHLSNVASSIGIARDPLHVAVVEASVALEQDIVPENVSVWGRFTQELKGCLKKKT